MTATGASRAHSVQSFTFFVAILFVVIGVPFVTGAGGFTSRIVMASESGEPQNRVPTEFGYFPKWFNPAYDLDGDGRWPAYVEF